jgi:hypothetical protein
MQDFVHRHRDSVIGVLSGFDRLLLRGTQRMLCTLAGLMSFLWSERVLLKDFGRWSQDLTHRVRRAGQEVMEEADRPVVYLSDPAVRKDDLARDIAHRDGITQGPVCLLEAVEPCWSYNLRKDAKQKKLVLEPAFRKCVHQYHYAIHPQVGFMHVRVQTWLPLAVRVYVNGREWLCREMDRDGLPYQRRGNCLVAVGDVAAAQGLLDRQLEVHWPRLLGRMLGEANPALGRALRMEGRPLAYYWSIEQSEWATDVMFKSPAALAEIYPRLIRQGVTTLGCTDVMRFLGKKLTATGEIHGNFAGQVVSDLRRRPEGMRLKYAVNGNSLKFYDKEGSVLRVETTINDPAEFEVYRGTAEQPEDLRWRPMRQGVADAHRRARVSQASNERGLSSLAAMECPQTLGEVLEPLGRGLTRKGRRYRGLRVLEAGDGKLLQAVGRGEFALNGFRNADIRARLGEKPPTDCDAKTAARRLSARVSRKLTLLRAHGLIARVPRTRRWMLTDKGRQVTTLLASAKAASAQKLMDKAA